jgi:hypothetical protein
MHFTSCSSPEADRLCYWAIFAAGHIAPEVTVDTAHHTVCAAAALYSANQDHDYNRFLFGTWCLVGAILVPWDKRG